jgi:hypothetical protein
MASFHILSNSLINHHTLSFILNSTLSTKHELHHAADKETDGNNGFMQSYFVVAAECIAWNWYSHNFSYFSVRRAVGTGKHFLYPVTLLAVGVLLPHSVLPCQVVLHEKQKTISTRSEVRERRTNVRSNSAHDMFASAHLLRNWLKQRPRPSNQRHLN